MIKKVKTIIIIVVIALILISSYFIFFKTSEGSLNEISSEQSEGINSQALEIKNCGVVSQEEINKLMQPEPVMVDNVACISEKMKDCESAEVIYKGAAGGSDTKFEVAKSEEEKTCEIKISGDSTDPTISCGYPKTYLELMYKEMEKQNKEWASAYFLHFQIGIQTVSKTGTINFKTPDQYSEDITCEITTKEEPKDKITNEEQNTISEQTTECGNLDEICCVKEEKTITDPDRYYQEAYCNQGLQCYGRWAFSATCLAKCPEGQGDEGQNSCDIITHIVTNTLEDGSLDTGEQPFLEETCNEGLKKDSMTRVCTSI